MSPGTGRAPMKFGPIEIDAPKWDGKLVLAPILFVGSYVIAWRLPSPATRMPAENVPLVRDQLLVLGPAIGVIVGALFRTTAADERASARNADVTKTAIETPSLVAPSGTAADLGDQVRQGAEEGARDGVTDGLTGNSAGGSPQIEDPEPEILR